MEQLVIFGAGSQTPEVVDFVNRYHLYEIVGFSVDESHMAGRTEYMGLPLYPMERLEEYIDKNKVKLFVAISWYNYMNRYKRQKYEQLEQRGFQFANLISPHAIICSEDIGQGNWFKDRAYVAYGVHIGNNNVLSSMIGHYTKIGNHNVFTGNSNIAGHVTIGDQNFFGLSSTVFNRTTIGNKNIIGGGVVLKNDLGSGCICSCPDPVVKKVGEKCIEAFLPPRKMK